MGQITNGTVEYSRRLKTGDYEYKDAKVSLSFSVSDGDDEARSMAKFVSALAMERAHIMTGELEEQPAGIPEKATRTSTQLPPDKEVMPGGRAIRTKRDP